MTKLEDAVMELARAEEEGLAFLRDHRHLYRDGTDEEHRQWSALVRKRSVAHAHVLELGRELRKERERATTDAPPAMVLS